MIKNAETERHTETTEEYIDALVGRAAAAQKEFQAWSEEATDRLLYALARHRLKESVTTFFTRL